MSLTVASNQRSNNVAFAVLVLVVILKLVGQYFVVDPAFDLQRDEYLHIDQGYHLAWGYQSVPPLTSWISYLIIFFGKSFFWVKFFPAVFGAATIIAAYKITETLGGNLFARTLTIIALLCSILFRVNMLYQPNTFDILSWTLLYYFLIKYVEHHQTKWLLWAAVVFALGFLNKYNIVFLGAALVVAFAATQERKIFTKRHTYAAGLLALLLISPNLLWQYSNGFPVVHHMKELAETQLVHVERSGFLKEQIFMYFQALFLIIAALVAFVTYAPFKKYRFVGFSFIFCIALFVYAKAKDYYALGLYPVLIAFGAVYLQYILATGWRRYLKPITFLFIVAFFYPFVIRLPILPPEKLGTTKPFSSTGPHRWEDGKKYAMEQDYADMVGWKLLAQKTDSVYKTLPVNDYTIIIANNYGQAGAINFYSKLKAVSFNADYINWFDLSKPIKNIILIQELTDTSSHQEIRPIFEKMYVAAAYTHSYSREKGERITVLKNALIDVNELLQKKIEQFKKENN